MQITIKTMAKDKKDSFSVDVEPEKTVLELKQKVQEARSEFEASSSKLICQGRILNNEKTCSESGLKEGDFLVIIPGKKAPEAASGAGT